MPDIELDINELDDMVQNITEDASAFSQEEPEMIIKDNDLYQRYLQYQMMMTGPNMDGVNVDVMNERMYNLSDDPYGELQRRLNMQDEDDSDDLAVAIDLQRDIQLDVLFQEYLASNLWDDDYGQTLSFSEFIDLKEQEVSQEEINELDATPEHMQEQDDAHDEDENEDGIESEEYTDDDIDKKDDDFGFDDDYDEYSDDGDELDVPDDEFDDDFEIPEYDVDAELESEFESETESDVLPEDQDDFPDMGNSMSLQESVTEYGSPDEAQSQLVPETQVVPEFVTHEQFESKDALDDMARGMSLATGVVEIEEVNVEKTVDTQQRQLEPNVPTTQPAIQEEIQEEYIPDV